MKKVILVCFLITLFACTQINNKSNTNDDVSVKPNLVIFYVDDLGWGDVSSYGATQVSTPNIDKLAQAGIRYTDAHSSSATCTPSRYSLLTGEHAFRRNVGILPGDAAMVIDPSQPTLPKMLKKAGYTTAVVGKWHLGLGDGRGPINWNQAIKPGPLEIGFDYSFLLPATGDRVPAVYLENHHVLNLTEEDPLSVSYSGKIGTRPTGYESPELMRQRADNQHNKTIINGISRIGWMAGGKSAEWIDEDFPFVFTEKANNFIAQNSESPFFLFFSFHDIHVPRLPNAKFQGATDMGVRGDAIVQMDWMVGQVVNQLEAQGVLHNTLIVFTSDNGPVLTDGYDDEAKSKIGDHLPAGPYSGGKYSALEAGTRVPFIVHYPAKTLPGVSHALTSQIDIYASMASLLGVPLNSDEAIDSQNVLPTLLDAHQSIRDTLIEESMVLSVRQGPWKYIPASNAKVDWIENNKNIDPGVQAQAQLYNLQNDPGETHNLAEQYPEKLNQMQRLIDHKKQQVQRQ